jgi:hypothetical protein
MADNGILSTKKTKIYSGRRRSTLGRCKKVFWILFQHLK